jgi:hypothetical protein
MAPKCLMMTLKIFFLIFISFPPFFLIAFPLLICSSYSHSSPPSSALPVYTLNQFPHSCLSVLLSLYLIPSFIRYCLPIPLFGQHIVIPFLRAAATALWVLHKRERNWVFLICRRFSSPFVDKKRADFSPKVLYTYSVSYVCGRFAQVCLLLLSQKPFTGPYPEPAESSPLQFIIKDFCYAVAYMKARFLRLFGWLVPSALFVLQPSV